MGQRIGGFINVFIREGARNGLFNRLVSGSCDTLEA